MKNSLSILMVVITCTLLISACGGGYGEKVEINKKSEIYISDGATKEEAQNLGAFLLRNAYFDNTTQKSVQLLHEDDTMVVKFVVNEEKLKNDEEATIAFRYFQTLIRDSVFAGKPTKLILTDDKFNTVKNIKEFTKDELEATVDTGNDSTEMEETKVDTTRN